MRVFRLTTKTQQTPLKGPEQGSSKFQEEYQAYMTSSRWARRKLRYYATHQKICRACGSSEKIHLHHHTYARLTHEHDDDLIPLCESCRDTVRALHKLAEDKGGKKKKTLTAITREFVKFYGGEFHPPRRRMNQTQRDKNKVDPTEGRTPPPGYITKQEAAEILGVDVSLLPEPKQNKRDRRGFFARHLIVNWRDGDNKPRWLREALPPPPVPGFEIGTRVVITTDASHLGWARGLTAVVVEQASNSTWLAELDGRPGSRLAVTTMTAQACPVVWSTEVL